MCAGPAAALAPSLKQDPEAGVQRISSYPSGTKDQSLSGAGSQQTEDTVPFLVKENDIDHQGVISLNSKSLGLVSAHRETPMKLSTLTWWLPFRASP